MHVCLSTEVSCYAFKGGQRTTWGMRAPPCFKQSCMHCVLCALLSHCVHTYQAIWPLSRSVNMYQASWPLSFWEFSVFYLVVRALRLKKVLSTVSSFMWVLGIWTHVLTLTQQALYPPNALPRPGSFILLLSITWLLNIYEIIWNVNYVFKTVLTRKRISFTNAKVRGMHRDMAQQLKHWLLLQMTQVCFPASTCLPAAGNPANTSGFHRCQAYTWCINIHVDKISTRTKSIH